MGRKWLLLPMVVMVVKRDKELLKVRKRLWRRVGNKERRLQLWKRRQWSRCSRSRHLKRRRKARNPKNQKTRNCDTHSLPNILSYHSYLTHLKKQSSSRVLLHYNSKFCDNIQNQSFRVHLFLDNRLGQFQSASFLLLFLLLSTFQELTLSWVVTYFNPFFEPYWAGPTHHVILLYLSS